MIEEVFLLFWVVFREFKKSPNWDVRFNLKRTLFRYKNWSKKFIWKISFYKITAAITPHINNGIL
ncbi:hypothetical protein J18TS1_11570 [Oceanobacillus oncorhynchi subsp. incaldanensis]|nr:hypothetical protein J18TS1_11570 [Oceanobacillus oncorhynchi subsp. incaldanensis]